MFEIEIDFKREAGFCNEHGHFENLGAFVGDRIIWSGCTLCVSKEIEEENKAIAVEAERLMNKRLYDEAAFPKRYENKNLENFFVENKGQMNALGTALLYGKKSKEKLSNGSGLLFYGACGTGKTHLAIGIGKKFLEANLSVMYVRASALIREVKETWSKTSKVKEGEVYAKYSAPDLLIVDEIGRQFGTDSEKMILFEIINERYEQMKPIIAITNLDGVNLSEYIGVAALDRLKENGESICFDWSSYR